MDHFGWGSMLAENPFPPWPVVGRIDIDADLMENGLHDRLIFGIGALVVISATPGKPVIIIGFGKPQPQFALGFADCDELAAVIPRLFRPDSAVVAGQFGDPTQPASRFRRHCPEFPQVSRRNSAFVELHAADQPAAVDESLARRWYRGRLTDPSGTGQFSIDKMHLVTSVQCRLRRNCRAEQGNRGCSATCRRPRHWHHRRRKPRSAITDHRTRRSTPRAGRGPWEFRT